MNLNPIKWVVDGVATVASSYQARKQAKTEADTAIANKKVEYKMAKLESKIQMVMSRRKHDSSYDMQVLKNRSLTWLDEALGVSIIGMTLLAFLPWTQPYIKDGWDAVSAAPFWFQFAWYVLIVSTLGGLTVLRIMMGKKGGASLLQRATTKTDPASRPDTPPRIQKEGVEHHERTDQQEEPEDESQVSEQEQDRQVSPRPGPPHGGGR